MATFGEPTRAGDNDKTDAEWIVNTPHGVATIYNYKDSHAYLGEAGLDAVQIIEWHVGAKNTKTYGYICSKVLATSIKRIG